MSDELFDKTEITLDSILAEYGVKPQEPKPKDAVDAPKSAPRDDGFGLTPQAIREEILGVGRQSGDGGTVYAQSILEKYASSVFDASAAPEDEPETGFPEVETEEKRDDEVTQFSPYEYAEEKLDDEIIRAVEEAIEAEQSADERGERFAARVRRREDSDEHYHITVPEEPEPDFKARSRAFARQCNSAAPRAAAALVLAALLVAATLLFEHGVKLPFGIGRSPRAATGALLIGQLLVMMLSVDLIVSGIERVMRGTPAFESLLAFANLSVVLTGILSLRGTEPAPLLPYSAVCAAATAVALFSERMHLQSLSLTLRTAAEPDQSTIVCEFHPDDERTFLRRKNGVKTGFYAGLTQLDASSASYSYVVPLVLVFAAVTAVCMSVLTRNFTGVFPRMFSAVLTGACAIQASLSFAAPFYAAVKSSAKRGISLAGPAFVDDAYLADGVFISDEDIYPDGTIWLGDVREVAPFKRERVLRVAASLAESAGGSLAPVFDKKLAGAGLAKTAVKEFAYAEDGVSGVVGGDGVFVGTSAFMKRQHIRVPENEPASAVYVSINGSLAGIIPVEYEPLAAVQRSLLAMIRRNVRCCIATRNFGVTLRMLSAKFAIAEDDVEKLSVSKVYAEDEGERRAHVAAVIKQGGIESLSAAILVARRVSSLSTFLTMLSVITTTAGAVAMAALSAAGAWQIASAGQLLVFMLGSALLSVVVSALGSMFLSAK
ncbi:MAG: hypothetical protein LBS90_04605 [Oscillospiraceae bacterium]|jgi:hypothetical protein|nr:hypothetical protein [Oscillospiraceae bacterium]